MFAQQFAFAVSVVENARFGSAWIVTFGERKCLSLVKVSWCQQECPARVSSKSALTRASSKSASKSVKQERPSKSVQQKCQARVSSKSVKQECPARVSSKSVRKECQKRVSSKECHERASHKTVKQEWPARVSKNSGQQERQSVFSRVSDTSVQHDPFKILNKNLYVRSECPESGFSQECQKECQARMSHKDVSQKCLAGVSFIRGLKRGSIRVRGLYQFFLQVFNMYV